MIIFHKCNLCIGSINFIKKHIKPRNLNYIQLSKIENGEFDFKKYGIRNELNIRIAHKAIALISENDLMYGYK